MHIRRLVFLAQALLWLAGPSWAGDAGADSSPEKIRPSVPRTGSTNRFNFIQYIDRQHATISGYVVGFGEGMDQFLSHSFRKSTTNASAGRLDTFVTDPRLDADEPGSWLRLSPTLKLRDAEGLSFGLKANGKLRLPRFEDRVELIISSYDQDDSLLGDLDRRQSARAADEREGTASVRYQLKDRFKFKVSADAGLRFEPKPDPRLGLRLRTRHEFEAITARFTQRFFWKSIDGFGELSQLDVEHQKPRDYLYRMSTSGLLSEENDGFEAGQSFSYYKYLSGRRVIGARAGVTVVWEPKAVVDNYTIRLLSRKRIHRDWIFLELEPGVDFPRERDYQATGFVQLKIDFIFGDWKNR